MFYVYAIYNRKQNKIYIGQTENLEERLRAHNDHRFLSSYTSRFDGEWELIYKAELLTRNEVLVREKQLKSYQGRLYVRKYIPL